MGLYYMTVIFTKWNGNKAETREFEVKELRYGGYLTIMDIEGMGWRSITQDQYDEFHIVEKKSENS